MADYVFSLRGVRKAHGDKVVLDNVTLSFLHGAKIGVVGPNGTGKSSLFKIMAGLDHPSNGDAIKDPDATVGILLQEPPLTEDKTVLENVEEAVAAILAKKARLDEISVELELPVGVNYARAAQILRPPSRKVRKFRKPRGPERGKVG